VWLYIPVIPVCDLSPGRFPLVSVKDYTFPGVEVGNIHEDAKYDDTKFISKVAERFLAGILDGLSDGESQRLQSKQMLKCVLSVLPFVRYPPSSKTVPSI
jgi:hypothetical protein